MTNVVSALTARTQLGKIMKRVSQNNERFVIDRRGQPIGIIMSIKDYINTMAPAPKELRAMQQRAKKTGMNKLTTRQIDNLIAEVRLQERGNKTTKQPAK